MEEMTKEIMNNEVIEVAEDTVTKTKFSMKKAGIIGGAIVLGCGAAYGIKKLWNKRKAKKALEPVDEPIDGECEIIDDEKSEGTEE